MQNVLAPFTSPIAGRRRFFQRASRQHSAYLLMLLPGIALIGYFFLYPLVNVVEDSFGSWSNLTLDYYDRALTSPIYRGLWSSTLQFAVITTLGCLVLGYPVAYYLATSSGWRRTILFVTVAVPLITHFVPQTSIWRIVLGRYGWVNETLEAVGLIDQPLEILFTRFSVTVSMIQIFLPLMILCIYVGMLGIPKGLNMAAQSLGATPFRSFLRVLLPLSFPGIFAGSLLVLALSLGAYAAPDILGNIQHRGIASFLRGGGPFNSSLSMLLLAVVLLIYLVFVKFIGFKPLYPGGQSVIQHVPETEQWRSSGRIILGIMVSLIGVYLLLPSIVVTILSFSRTTFLQFPPTDFTWKWYATYFNGDDPMVDWISSTLTSFETAVISSAVAVLLGILISYSLVRGRYPGKQIVGSLMLAPLVVPTVVLAGIIFRLYFFGSLNILMGTVPGLAIPHIMLALPYAIIILTAALRNADETQELAAESLGAKRLARFRHIIFPQIYPAIGVALFVSFLVSFNELILALTLKSRGFQTVSMNIWNARTGEFTPMATAVSTMMLVLAIVVILAVISIDRYRKRQSRSAGSTFRYSYSLQTESRKSSALVDMRT